MPPVSRYLLTVCASLLLIAAIPHPAFPQDTAGTGTLRGRVADSGGGVTRDVAVCILATAQCAVSDTGGLFSLVMRPGSYELEVTAPGRPVIVSDTIQVRAGLESLVDIMLPSAGVQQTVTVTASSLQLPEEVKTSGYAIGPGDIAASAGALQDVARYVQSLPGVVIGNNDFRNDLIVRGGSPLENLYIVDNIEIPNINTFATFASAGGTVSVLDVALIDNVTFLTGGYPAAFGNRTSSVLQIAQREGRRDRIGARATLGFAGAGAVAEGPLGSRQQGSWIVSARRSFLDLFTSDTGIGGVPVLYTLNAKAVYDLTSRDRIWVLNLSSVDRIRLGLTEDSDFDSELSNLDIQYRGRRSATGFNWQRVHAGGVSLLGLTHARASVNQRVKDLLRGGVADPQAPVADQIANGELVFEERSSEAETALKYDFSSSALFFGTIQVGGAVKAIRVDYDTASPFGTDSPFFPADSNPFSLRERLRVWQTGVYAQGTREVATGLTLTGGARLDHYALVSAVRFSPRLGVDYALTPRLSLRGSYGQYYQQPFFLFLTAYPENRDLEPFRADHYVGGLSFDAGPFTRASVEFYRKNYRDYPVSSQIPSLSLANVGDTFSVRDILFPMIGAGRGVVTGIETHIERGASGSSRWNGKANLTFSRARHAGFDGILRLGSFDYPIVANVVGGYRLGRGWSLAARVAYLTGRPYTPVDAIASTEQRRAVYDLSRVNAERATDYFRLDLRLDRVFTRGDRHIALFAGVQNVTNRRNFASYSWDRRNNVPRTSDQLGLFPILGIEWPF